MLGFGPIITSSSRGLIAALALAAAGFATQASADVVTYDVNMNFDPLVVEGGPGVGTITGTVTYDSTANAILGVNLTESTNDGAVFGGAFLSPTYTSLTFTQFQPDVITFFGSPDPLATSSVQVRQINNQPYLAMSFQTANSVFDGSLIGPGFQFDFPEAGGSVIPGNFDSITSDNKYLFGTVTIQPADTGTPGVPEPATWMMMLLGVGALGGALRRRPGLAMAR